ncbi:hypothetical protein AAFO92_09645 [Roseovarius sp. CAU 1744]|uniref:hypothetical protein n=1 Tax=Roseovarius sp. CAU 1744 TaxID=3140368 RepID=UPI00325AC804
MVYILPLICFILSLIAARFAIKYYKDSAVWIAVLCLFGLAIWAIFQGRQAHGWDGLGYMILSVLIAMPAQLGLIAGAIWGQTRERG